jgi:AcrR family transcriptional regulator
MAKRRAGKPSGRGGDESRDRDRADTVQRIERAMLELVGEHGYAAVTVADVLARSGSNRSQFYAAFAGKRNCFEAAYGAVADSLLEKLLERCTNGSARGGVREALDQLVEFLSGEPGLARGVLTESGPVGDDVAAKRREVVGRLTLAVDRACREIPNSRHTPPQFTARFIVGAIEAIVIRELREPGVSPDLANELAGLTLAYFPEPDARDPTRRGPPR